MRNMSIDCKAIINHINGKSHNEFERRRNKAEYDKMIKHIQQIVDEPFYRWPKEDVKYPKK